MTPEQSAAQEALEKAIADHVKAFRSEFPEGHPEMATDWMLVACVSSFPDGGDRMVAYHMAFSGGEMDEHRAVGLCRVAESLVLIGERE